MISLRATTRRGNTLIIDYNEDTGLITGDFVSSDESHGNEFIRRFVDEDELLNEGKIESWTTAHI